MIAAFRLTARTKFVGRGIAFAVDFVGTVLGVMLAYRFLGSESLDALPVDAIVVTSAADIPSMGPADDFELNNQHGQRVRLVDLRGRAVLTDSEAG